MEWKPVPSFIFVEASSTGLIRTVDHETLTVQAKRTYLQKRKGRVLQPIEQRNGYLGVNLPAPAGFKGRQRIFSVHRLVCLAFHGEPPTGKDWALHRDDNRFNNHAVNLYWGSPKSNASDANENGLRRKRSTHPMTPLSEADVATIKARYKAKTKANGAYALAEEYGVHRTTIENIVRGRTWK